MYVFFLYLLSLWVMPYLVKGLLTCWGGGFKVHQSVDVWNAILPWFMWCIWKELNLRSFERIESLLLQLKFFFLRSLYNWVPDMHGSTLIINLGQSHGSYMGPTRMHEYMQ